MVPVVYLTLLIIWVVTNTFVDSLITLTTNDTKTANLEKFLFNQPESLIEHYNETDCYGVLGCLSTGGWFFDTRPFNVLPAPREVIGTSFLLYTIKNIEPQIIVAGNRQSIIESNFDVGIPTKCLVHGFFQNVFLVWIQDMIREILKHGNFNVIVVDWSGGAGFPYLKAVNNARLVGMEIALLLNFLKDNFGLDLKDCHLIGHSLGAHICGYAGERLENLGRITGLDPAEMFFQNTHPKVHLDYTDALFVDVIHTNSKRDAVNGYGMYQPMGHIDFYPNGGEVQPGCKQRLIDYVYAEGITEGVQIYLACNHRRARKYFLESINSNCSFLAFECDSYDSFKQGLCTSCGKNNSKCSFMGFHADQYKANKRRLVNFYLDTGGQTPFCRYHYLIEIKLASKPHVTKQKGKIFLTLYGEANENSLELKTESIIILRHGQTYRFIQSHKKQLGSIKQIAFGWQYKSVFYDPFSWNIFRKPEINIESIRIVQLGQQYSVLFCDLKEKIFPKEVHFFNKTDCGQETSTTEINTTSKSPTPPHPFIEITEEEPKISDLELLPD